MSNELKDTLKKRLDENYAAFIESLQGKTPSELIAMAPEITAAQQLHEELLDACDEEDVAFLLRFDDPLETVRGYWESEITATTTAAKWATCCGRSAIENCVQMSSLSSLWKMQSALFRTKI